MKTITGAQAITALGLIHHAMAVPFEWSADTPEAVWAILDRYGYTMPEESFSEEMEDEGDYFGTRLPPRLEPYRPEPRP